MLKHLKKVRIEFNPLQRGCATALEFLSQCQAKPARDSNPSCELIVRRRTDTHPPFVQVTFNNGYEETINCLETNAQTIRKSILTRADEMETAQVFRDAGLQWPVIIPDEEARLAEALAAKGPTKRRR